ncbi:MAG: hypothetical protein AAF393_02685 [Pseudomonadota bacterium]
MTRKACIPLLSALALAACQPAEPIAKSAPDRVAGVDREAIISVTGRPDLYLAVYRSKLIDPVQLANLPVTLCNEAGEAVKEVKDRKPYDPAAYPADARLLFVECV